MAQREWSIGFFGLFGRSPALREFDKALRAVDLHPKLVPEAVKLAALGLIDDHARGKDPGPQAYAGAAEILAYCALGPEHFAGANGEALAGQVERRIEEALGAGVSLDAQLVLLALHAKVIQPSVVESFQLESGTD
jgi:hypothetical protein